MDQRDHCPVDYPERSTHAVDTGERAIDVESLLEILHLEMRHASPCGEEHGDRVGGMERDHRPGRIDHVAGGDGETVTSAEPSPPLLCVDGSHRVSGVSVYLGLMITDNPQATAILDRDLIGFLTAVNGSGQPQTAPVWFMRDGNDIVVYNRPDTPRLASIAANPKVVLGMRGDIRATGALILEGNASLEGLPRAAEFPGYTDKYGGEIERLGWTPDEFSEMYSEGLRITITRLWAWGLDSLAK